MSGPVPSLSVCVWSLNCNPARPCLDLVPSHGAVAQHHCNSPCRTVPHIPMHISRCIRIELPESIPSPAAPCHIELRRRPPSDLRGPRILVPLSVSLWSRIICRTSPHIFVMRMLLSGDTASPCLRPSTCSCASPPSPSLSLDTPTLSILSLCRCSHSFNTLTLSQYSLSSQCSHSRYSRHLQYSLGPVDDF